MKNLSPKESGFHYPATTMIKNGNKWRNGLLSAMLVAIIMLACSGPMLLAKESTLKGYFLINGEWKKGTLKGDGISIDGDIATAEPPCTLKSDDGKFYSYKAKDPIVVGYKPPAVGSGAGYASPGWIVSANWFPPATTLGIKCLVENLSLIANAPGLMLSNKQLIENQILMLTMLNLADTTGMFNDDNILAMFIAMNCGTYVPNEDYVDFLARIPAEKLDELLLNLFEAPDFMPCGWPCHYDTIVAYVQDGALQDLFAEKLQTSPDFQAMYEIAQDSIVTNIVATIKASPEYQACLEYSAEAPNSGLIYAICDASNYKIANSLSESTVNNSISNISLYPNPASQHATLSFNTLTEVDMHITLCDVTGLTLMEIYNGPVAAGNFTRTLELKSLVAGTYYIKIASGEDVLIEKMIVK